MGARPGSFSKTGRIHFCSTRVTSNPWHDVTITFNFFFGGGVVFVLLCVYVCCLVVFLLFVMVYKYVVHKQVISAALTSTSDITYCFVFSVRKVQELQPL